MTEDITSEDMCVTCGIKAKAPKRNQCWGCAKKVVRTKGEDMDETPVNPAPTEDTEGEMSSVTTPEVTGEDMPEDQACHAALVTEDTPGAVRRIVGAKTMWVLPGHHFIGKDPDVPWVWSSCLDPDCSGTNMADRGTQRDREYPGSHAEESLAP